MNISIASFDHLTEESSEQVSKVESKGCSYSDYELIASLISLADMLDQANEKIEVHEEKQETILSREEGTAEERFSFLSGWDRLMNRFRDSCTSRNMYSVCF